MDPHYTSQTSMKASLSFPSRTFAGRLGNGVAKNVRGEVVFQTGMVGYLEALTDPSYYGQILVFTFPMIGNYGTSEKAMESSKIQVVGVVVRDLWVDSSLTQLLADQGIPILTGVDTRDLVTFLREEGTLEGTLVLNPECKTAITFPISLDKVSCEKPYIFQSAGEQTVIVVDCGLKQSQLTYLLRVLGRSVTICVVPFDYDYSSDPFDGLFISNGPGDPADAEVTVEILRRVLENEANKTKPIFGICLGHQILARAIGAETYKMPYGNRGHNIPVFDLITQKAFITSQNHGYAVDETSLPNGWVTSFRNLNDKSNEGMMHERSPWCSVQFHPEASGGPLDTTWLFDDFADRLKGTYKLPPLYKPKVRPAIKKVLILGSGGLTIGQAGEFDYSGSQALKAYKSKGIFTVLVNPNIATVQTTTGTGLADKVYSLPVTPEYIEEIIKTERPDAISLSFGGQTALNCGVALHQAGILERYDVFILGTSIDAVIMSEDREAFASFVKDCGFSCAPSKSTQSLEEALAFAEEVGYPVLVRSGFALGGLGSGFASNAEELTQMAGPIFTQDHAFMTIDKSLKGFKEVEYEIVRDCDGNCITVCNMENFDPVGIHTGESIVVAPSLTLDDETYFRLRKIAQVVAHGLQIVGECNIQYALNPEDPQEVYIIEVNARLSRSSALASKATGYPLAYIAALLSLNETLPSLPNSLTKDTSAMFEPSLDFCVVKIPKWDLSKFPDVDPTLGTAMKSVGEAEGIGATFEEALLKAMRMVGLDLRDVITFPLGKPKETEEHESFGTKGTPDRLIHLFGLLIDGTPVEPIAEDTGIHPHFLRRMNRVVQVYNKLWKALSPENLWEAKRCGLSDLEIAKFAHTTATHIREERDAHGIHPVVKRIDTVAAEFPCSTNYLYLTYWGDASDDLQASEKRKVLTLGSGPYRIGSSVEFDWCAVSCVRALKAEGCTTLMLNCNPETVSTDYDEADRLYFEEISLETILEIQRLENFVSDRDGLIVSVGGQTSNNLAMDLHRAGVNILGTSPEMIDMAENRFSFSRLLDSIGLAQPKWKRATDRASAKAFCEEVGFPCLVRPSYVLSGAAMNVAFCLEDLMAYLDQAVAVSADHPVVLTRFVLDAKEIEVDAVVRKGEIEVMALCEHIENAGVHSGDATLIHPPQDLTKQTVQKIEASTKAIAKALEIDGPLNIQFIAKDDKVEVIEANVRASRSFPFVSKLKGHNLIERAVKVILEKETKPYEGEVKRIGVKVPTFSFSRLKGADCVLGVEMMSTGEVACFGETLHEAYRKAILSAGFTFPTTDQKILLSVGAFRHKGELLDHVSRLSQAGFTLLGTTGTADFYRSHGLTIETLSWHECYRDALLEKGVSFVINVSMLDRLTADGGTTRGYRMRRYAIDHGLPLFTDVKATKLFIDTLLTTSSDPTVNPRIDCDTSYEKLYLPGLIDVHVHVREPGDIYKGDWDSESHSAIAGGIDTILVMPNTRPPITTPENLEIIRACAREKAVCTYGFYLGGCDDNHAEIKEMMDKQDSDVVGMKLYLDCTFSGGLQFREWSNVEKHFAQWTYPQPIVVHTEYENFLRVLGLMAIYPQVRVHVAHVHDLDMMKAVVRGKQLGMKLTCEVTPHHFLLDRESIKRPVKPPLQDVQPHLEDFMEYIDCFATDHAPHRPEEHHCPGYPCLETFLALMLMTFGEDLVMEKMYHNPRKIFGLPPSRTSIVVSKDHEWIIPDALPFSRASWTPYSGWKVRGKVTQVERDGQTIFVDGSFVEGKALRGSAVVSSHVVSTEETREVNFFEPVPQMPRRARRLSNAQDSDWFRPQSLLSVDSLSRQDLRTIFQRAFEMKMAVRHEILQQSLQGKVFGFLFYEPSSRTEGSFQSAIQRLGGTTVSFSPERSSVKKGESFADTIRCLASISEGMILRTSVPLTGCKALDPYRVINGGDGINEHPTQALLDLFTIREKKSTITGWTIALVGDLAKGRTVHSLAKLLCLYDVRLRFVAPPSRQMPPEIVTYCEEAGIEVSFHEHLYEIIETSDVIYMTRLQKERSDTSWFSSDSPSLQILDLTLMAMLKDDAIVMHPGPRLEELPVEVDSDPRCVVEDQMKNGLFVRMALLDLMFS